MSTSLAEINVVPLVDVMLVLLVIFMVAAPMMQQGLQVNLPRRAVERRWQAQPLYVTIPAGVRPEPAAAVRHEEIGHRRARRAGQAGAAATRDDKSVFLRMDGAVTAQDIMLR